MNASNYGSKMCCTFLVDLLRWYMSLSCVLETHVCTVLTAQDVLCGPSQLVFQLVNHLS